MAKQIPLGPKDQDCHRCLPKKVPCSDVCHKCKLWKMLRGRDPNSGQEIDEWMCVDESLLMGLLEVAKVARSGAAATESFRNEMISLSVASINAARPQPQQERLPQIDRANSLLIEQG